jgi:hypothetical protein
MRILQCMDEVQCIGRDLRLSPSQFPVFGENETLLGVLPCEHCSEGVAVYGKTKHFEVRRKEEGGKGSSFHFRGFAGV